MYNCIWSMKKVLIVFNHPAPYKVRLFNELSKNFELHVIFERQSASDRNKSFYFENDYNFIFHKIRGLKLGRENILSNGIKKHLKNNKYDLIVMNGYSTLAEMSAIKYLKKHKMTYSFYINGGIIKSKESKLRKHIKTKYISGANFYFSPDEVSNEYLIYYGANKDKILNYPYSTIFESEILESEPNKIELRKNKNISFEKMFVSSGQLIKRKNYFSLVKEWKNYPENYGLFLLGDGEEKDRIVKYIQENNMKNVILPGFLNRKEMFEYIKMSDVFLFPSKEDIYGHVINESLSQGVPVISTMHVNSSVKLIKNGTNGFLLEELNGEKLKEAIEYCLSNNLFDNCIKVAKENTIEEMAKVHVELFERAIK